ncbi:site-specific integrase [Paenochrobactrum pullorum]|uniref:site-specific integrase n=1 Tax=Paenochrobactrum pullorum TaxID=1324351 RepID=UPI0035BC373E
MATIRKKGDGQWHVQIRRKGWPSQTNTFRTKVEAETWARDIESSMDKGVFVDRSRGHEETLADLIDLYRAEVTNKRPGEASRIAENARLDRFLRDESTLCSFAVANLRPEHFIDYRNRRLTETASRGKEGGRGRYKNIEHVLKLRKDGAPRSNAAQAKAPPTAPKLISPGTVKRELTLWKNIIAHSKLRLNLAQNPVNSEDVKRPTAIDDRDVRLSHEEIDKLLDECKNARNLWLFPTVEFAFESGARRSSILRLEWKDVDLDRRTALLRRVKNSRNPHEARDIKIGLSPRAIQILNGLPDAPVRTGQVFKMTVDALKTAFDRARKRAELPHFRLHDARHERTSNLVEAGWSDTEVMAQTGHLDPKSLKRYANLRETFLADKLAELPSRKS